MSLTCKSGVGNLFVFPSLESLVVYTFRLQRVLLYIFSKSKGNVGTDDKRTITVTFITNLHGTILPMKFISGGKTVQSLNKFAFPEGAFGESIKIIK